MKILACFRPENITLAVSLMQRGHDLWVIPRDLMLMLRKMGFPAQPVDDVDGIVPDTSSIDGITGNVIRERIESVAATVASIKALNEKEQFDAFITWTDAPSLQRAMVLTANHIGIPTFEITHGALNTYRQGHFECESHVDYILAPGQEEADFRAFYGSKAEVIITGKPSFDWIAFSKKRQEREAIKLNFNLPDRRPIVLYGMTWRHPFSTWERDLDLGEGDVLKAHMNLKPECNPFLIIKPHYAKATQKECEGIAKWCEAIEAKDYAVTGLDLRGLLPAIDLVVSHKSSLLVEAVLMDIPAIGFDFRERNDFAFYAGRGIEWCASRSQLLQAMAKCLLDAPTRSRLATERASAKAYFNGLNDGMAAERCVDTIEQKVALRRAA